MKLTPEMIERLRRASAQGQKLDPKELARPQPAQGQPGGSAPGRPGGPVSPGTPGGPGGAARAPASPLRPGGEIPIGDDDDDKKKGGGVIGRDARQKGRQPSRGRGPSTGQPAVVLRDGKVETIDEKFGSRRGPRAALLRKAARGKVAPIIKEGRIEIAPPINVRSLSEAIGMKTGELSKRLLKETGKLYGVNSPIELEAAQLIALEKNIELVLKQQKTAERILLDDFEKMVTHVDPDKLRPRPPIVTIMGHVDHGKTSLLDKIRSSKIVDTEIGGITQVIRAWSVMHKIEDPQTGEKVIERPITFLDTPGHEAFTKMRARGANVTDIAVIVVAATDGVMQQTEEAINHARAANVRIIVAINKIDMPNANLDRTRRQLYSLNLLPDDMGGDTQFVETSAATGQGIDDLLTAILLEAELNLADKLQADPDRPATGTCLEAYMSADEGVMATVLVQQGTLKRGDILLCGSTFGRVRAMYDDMGIGVKEAGPSTPVRVTGLGEVPNADDPFYVVDDLAKAQEIAEVRRQNDREAALNRFTAPKDMADLSAAKSKAKITELKIILKAEARGSVEAIRKELEKLTHEEVRTRVLHAGIGAISESDVQLALTSPEDTLIVGFNVTADDPALHLAEERGISLREYQIIYNLVDDVKAALEGRLKPIEEVVHLGRAVIRQTFRISKVGTIAGCYVTSGVFERSARVRVIREGVVVFPQGDKVVGLDSLKRVKDDVKEVREGFECGMKITGYDDIKVGDVIEAYKIEIRLRTL
jgi:translation initiation factor IF-2